MRIAASIQNNRAFTLIEVVVVLVVSAILMTVAMRSGKEISDTAKVEETKQEMETIASAIVGNTELANAGTRADFGYVGDIGALPPNLTALVTDPGYGTWNGPYVRNRFEQMFDDYTKDAWGTAYSYSGGTTIQSSGSGTTIVRTLAPSTDQLLRNKIAGAVLDINGTPPGVVYRDSVTLLLIYPNGSGGYASRSMLPDPSGYFSFDSIPIGNHQLAVIYAPYNDTVNRYISVSPGSELYADFRMTLDLWSVSTSGGGGGGLIHVAGSDTAWGASGACDDISFWVENTGSSSVSINSLTLSWTAPTAYYERIRWGNPTVFNEQNPRVGSGDVAIFNSTKAVNPGAKVKIRVNNFTSTSSGGGSNVAMNNVTFQVNLSDGTTFTIVTGGCI
jgi:prepilin-type N-terminal cleavage/methylation domain-containing protein